MKLNAFNPTISPAFFRQNPPDNRSHLYSRLKAVCCVLLVLLLLSLPDGSGQAESGNRKLTILVYMCGSNLESNGGAASADILEMTEATKGVRDISLLVMTGGSKFWANGYQADRIVLHEIWNGLHRTVATMEQADMGSGRTLTSFLQLGAVRCPAERYALILWDHGGGPLEGVCWDEVFSMNHISLPELQDAIVSGGLGSKLSWIGFDACLMASLEVAVGLSEVTDYMIASEEKEPATGWNYGFLRGLTGDESSEEIGKRIVDAYFEGQENSGNHLTLSCIHLPGAVKAADALNAYFETLRADITENNFSEFSSVRRSAIAFGGGLKGTSKGDNGYDLVDAGSLISGMAFHPQEKAQLQQLLDEAVIYRRSGQEGSTGLTLYFPYENKMQYLSGWRDDYRRLNLLPGYSDFIRSFGTILTGDELFHWQNLLTEADGTSGTGEYIFHLQLTEEQAAHVGSAELMILQDTWHGGELNNAVSIISVSPASLDENSILTGTYDGTLLYAKTENYGMIGPLTILPASGGEMEVVEALYVPREDQFPVQSQLVFYFVNHDSSSEDAEILQLETMDEATQHMSTRLNFTEQPYRMIQFWNYNRSIPAPVSGVLPDYYEWSRNGAITALNFPLPEQWHFVRNREPISGNRLYALFRITDSQQNTVCSIPVPVENPNLISFSAEADQSRPVPDCTLNLSGSLRLGQAQDLHLVLKIENQGKAEATFSSRDLLLNGEREIIDWFPEAVIPAGHSSTLECIIERIEMAGLKKIQTLSFSISKSEGGSAEQTFPVQFLISGCDLVWPDSADVLGSSESVDGVSMEVIGIHPDLSYGFDISLLLENRGNRQIFLDYLTLNGFQLDSHVQKPLDPGRSRVLQVSWDNGVLLDNNKLKVPGADEVLYDTRVLRNLLGLHDQQDVREIGLYFGYDEHAQKEMHPLFAVLKEPWHIREHENIGAWLDIFKILDPEKAGDPTSPVPLYSEADCLVSLCRVILGKSEIVLLLEASNKTEEPLSLIIENLTANGGEASSILPGSLSFSMEGEILFPGCTRVFPLSLGGMDGVTEGMEIRDLSLSLHTPGEFLASPAKIALNSPAYTGGESLTFLDPDEMNVEPAVLKPQSGPAVPTADEIILPEKPDRYLRWVELPVSKEEQAQVSSGRVMLVSPMEDDTLAIYTVQDMTWNENHVPGAWLPGLVPVCAGEEDCFLPVRYLKADTQGLEAETVSVPWISNSDIWNYKTLRIKELLFQADYASGNALVTNISFEGDSFDRQEEMEIISCLYPIVEKGEEKEGRLLPFSEMTFVNGIAIGWEAYMEEQPFRIQLRPVRKEDQIQILFSVTLQDGTGYSILTPDPAGEDPGI